MAAAKGVSPIAWLIHFSYWSIPVLLVIVLGAGFLKGVKVYEVFIDGAFEGIKTTLKLTPYILAIFVAIGLFRNSGALSFMIYLLRPVIEFFHLPPDLLTLGILKPLSGSAALGTTAELLSKYGPDSRMGIIASIIQGSSETTFYVTSLYLGSVRIRDGRHILIVGLLSEFMAFLAAICIGSFISR